MGDVSDQVPEYGHSRPAAEGIEGLEVSHQMASFDQALMVSIAPRRTPYGAAARSERRQTV